MHEEVENIGLTDMDNKNDILFGIWVFFSLSSILRDK